MISTKQRIIRALIHVPIGLITVYAAYVSPVIALSLTISFLAYQIIEDWRIKDRSFHDVYGFLIGLSLGVFILGIFTRVHILGIFTRIYE